MQRSRTIIHSQNESRSALEFEHERRTRAGRQRNRERERRGPRVELEPESKSEPECAARLEPIRRAANAGHLASRGVRRAAEQNAGGPTSGSREASPVHSYHDLRDEAPEAPNQRSPYARRRRHSPSLSRSPPPRDRRQFRSRSPDRSRRRDRSSPRRFGRRVDRDQAPRGNDRRRGEAPPRREQRERSLSPFSKRLALTQAMNTSR